MNHIIKKYTECFKKFDEESIKKILKCVDKNIIFVDPFNKTKGKGNLERLLKDFLTKFNDINFSIFNITNDGIYYFVKWKLDLKFKNKKISFFGMSELILKNNFICSHIDYWDSGKNFYTNIPVLGRIFKKIHKNS
tara:strand:- start:187 stop:594 length:408 start_codon:yes stop_codon:yes gene_type:complete